MRCAAVAALAAAALAAAAHAAAALALAAPPRESQMLCWLNKRHEAISYVCEISCVCEIMSV